MTKEQNDGKIDYIEFPVDNIEAAKRFYRAVFGWEFTDGRVTGGFRSDQAPVESSVRKPGGNTLAVWSDT